MIEEPVLLQAGDVDSAPDRSGVYVWYSLPRLAPADDASPEAFAKALAAAANSVSPPDITIEGTTVLNVKWRGKLEARSEVSAERFESRSANARAGVRKVISSFGPLFLSPLYVGRTTRQTLRVRLEQHLYALGGAGRGDKDMRSFADRVTQAGIPLESLYVYCLPISAGSKAETEHVIELLERFFLLAGNPALSRK